MSYTYTFTVGGSVVTELEDLLENSYLVGPAFPLQFYPNGDMLLDTNENVLNSDIRLATFVRPYGIPLFPLGVGVEEFAFDNLDEVLMTELEIHVSDGVSNSVDGVLVQGSFQFEEDENTLKFVVPYMNTRINKIQSSVIVTQRHKVG